MPGASPNAALEAFLNPLREAVACLGGAQFDLTTGARGGDLATTHAWTLNGGAGLQLSGGRIFEATMHFKYRDAGRAAGRDRYRITTAGYLYSLACQSGEIVAAHWHPGSHSPVDTPHYHIGAVALSGDGKLLESAHIPSPRVSLEAFILFMIDQMNMPATRTKWLKQLQASHATFQKYQSWA